MKILIVEDEKKTGEYLTKGLTEAGFVVDLADNGLNGYHLAMTGDYDLLILDIMLPDVSHVLRRSVPRRTIPRASQENGYTLPRAFHAQGYY